MKKIRLLCLILAALLAAPFCLVSHGVDVSDEKPEILRVGFFAFSGYHTVGDDGRRGGYGYEFLQRIAIHGGWTYEYIGCDKSYSEALEMLKTGEIDIVTSVSKTEERER